jgi:hypothetical protein
MASVGQMTGMRGVYLVAAELSRNGFIASPTSRSAMGADILVTDANCKRAWSVQVKTNAKTHSFWLLNAKTKETVSDTHIYALVNLITRRGGETIEYFVVPSEIVAKRLVHDKSKAGTSEWWAIYRDKIMDYKDRWGVFA